MQRTNILKNLATLVLAGALLGGVSCKREVEKVTPKSYIPVEIMESNHVKTLRVPVYSLTDVKPLECSRYARLAAEEMFDKKFSATAAWNRRYQDRIAISSDEINNDHFLGELVSQGKLKPGMILGVHNPESHYGKELDQTGNRVKYTHNLVYLGVGKEGTPLFANQFVEKTSIVDEYWLMDHELTPVEFLDAKTK